MYESGEAMRWGMYIHSLLTGLSATFFIGLFSAGPEKIMESKCLWISTLLFSLSIILNSIFSVYYWFNSNDGELSFKLFTYSKLMNHTSNTAMAAPVISFVFLMFYYSSSIGVLTIVFAISLFFIVRKIIKELNDAEDKIHKDRMEAISIGNIDTLEKLDFFHDFPKTTREIKCNTIKFCALISLKYKLVDFLTSSTQGKMYDDKDIHVLVFELISTLASLCNVESFDKDLIKKIKCMIVELRNNKADYDEVSNKINELIELIDDDIDVKYYMVI